MTEKNDEIVEIHSSLMAGVAREILGRKFLSPGKSGFYLQLDDINMLINNVLKIANIEHDLYVVIAY